MPLRRDEGAKLLLTARENMSEEEEIGGGREEEDGKGCRDFGLKWLLSLGGC
jgi:hypothetical protein